MKHVTFTRDMKPHRAGEQRIIPDELAAKLEGEGAIEANPPDFPAQPQSAKPAADPRAERRGRQRYLTK